jgi:hypothetical protein
MPAWAHRLAEFIPTSSPYFGRVLLRVDEIEGLGVTITPDVMREVILKIHETDQHKKDLSRRLQAGRKNQVVYYMRVGDRVKIGTTINLQHRMAHFNPEELLATETGGHHLERQRHRQFGHLRTTGEWFKYEDDLRAHIDQVRSQRP